MPRFPRPSRALVARLALLFAGLAGTCGPDLRARERADGEGPAPEPAVLLDPLVVEDGDDGSADYDLTGLGARDAERNEPPFANPFLSDPAFDEQPLHELDQELGALLASRANAAEVAAGSETIDLRGFPAPVRRNGFTQGGIPEVLNAGRSELVLGSLVPVFGRAAPGGIRNIDTPRPRGRASRQLEAAIGTGGVRRAQARATGVVVPKKSWYLGSLGWSGRDGPQRYATTGQTGAGAALAVRHNRATSTLWTVDVLDFRGNPAPGIPEYRLAPGGPVVGPYLPLADFHSYGPRASVARQAGSVGFQLESQLRPDFALSSGTQVFVRRAEQDRFTTGQYVVSTGRFSGVREPTHREETFGGISHQTDLTRRFSALGAEHKALASVELSASESTDENRALPGADLSTLLPPAVRFFDPYAPDYYSPDYSPEVYRRVITDREIRLRSGAGLLSLRSAFNRGATVCTVGVRRDFAWIESFDRRAPGSASGIVPVSEKSLANTSFHAGLNQLLGPRLMVFATTSSAVQPSTRVDARTGEIQDNASTAGTELGARAVFLERRLTVGVMAYAYTNTDIVRRNPLYQDPIADAAQTQPQLVNSGEEEFHGLGAQLGWKPVAQWTFTARASWIDAITVSSPDLPEEEGLPLTQVPRFSAATGARYAFVAGPLRGLSVGGSITHLGEVVQTYARPGRERLAYPAYTVAGLDAAYTWRVGKVAHTVTASVGNLFDVDLLGKVARVGAERSLTVGWRAAF